MKAFRTTAAAWLLCAATSACLTIHHVGPAHWTDDAPAGPPVGPRFGAPPVQPVVSDNGIMFSNGVVSVGISQSAKPITDAGSGDSGYPLTVQAENGQTSVFDGGDGGIGGPLYLASGNGAPGGNNGQTGAPGPIYLNVGDASILELFSGSKFGPVTTNGVNLGDTLNQFGGITGGFIQTYLFDGGLGNPENVFLGQQYYSTAGGMLPCVGWNAGGNPISDAGDMSICDNGSQLIFWDVFQSQLLNMGTGSFQGVDGYFLLGAPTFQFQPQLMSNDGLAANQNITINIQQPPSAAVSGVQGSSLRISAAAGAPATGAAHTGGKGGLTVIQMTDGGTSGSSTSGAPGDIQFQDQTAAVIENWGVTHYTGSTTVTVATSGTTTLSAHQLQFANWLTNAPTLVGSATIAFGNNHVSGVLNLRGLTLSGQTLTLSCGSGTQAITSFTHPLWFIECDGSNHIDVAGN